MEDPTKGLELVPVSGQLYTIGQLRELAEKGAAEATQTSKNGREFAVQIEEDSGFRICCSDSIPAAYLYVKLDKTEDNVNLRRTLETVLEPALNPMEAKTQTQDLSSLRLSLDDSGSPTIYDGDTLLDGSGLMASLIDPVRKAVGDS